LFAFDEQVFDSFFLSESLRCRSVGRLNAGLCIFFVRVSTLSVAITDLFIFSGFDLPVVGRANSQQHSPGRRLPLQQYRKTRHPARVQLAERL
jgi:hypothetical protein